jgi:hypothetical protein
MGNVVAPDYSAFNFGYVSPKMRGRVDKDFYNQCQDYQENYISSPEGELSFRTGTIYANITRGNRRGRLIPFLFNTEQAYQIEATDQAFRFYKDNGLVTNTALNITAITKAAAAQVTITAHGLSVNDPLIFENVSGMHQINGQEGLVASVVDANNITVSINTTSYSTYTAGGTAAKIVEIATPYTEAQLFELDFTQTNDTMYIVHRLHQPRKLTRGGSHILWTLATFDYIGNPFGVTKAASQTISNITQTDPAVITYVGADTFANGDTVFISKVLGMTQINDKNITVSNVNEAANTFEAALLNATTFTAYVSGGILEELTTFSWPSVVTLFEGRLVYGASDAFPTRLWFSKAGFLDDFTLGTLAGDALQYNIRADQANRIRWISGAEDYLVIGTSGSEFRASGGGNNDGITPTNVSIKPSSFNGVSAVRPQRLDSYILYIQRNGRTVRSFEYDALRDGYSSPDRTLLADHIGKSKIKQISYTSGTPNIIWCVRNDGKLLGLTFDPKQELVAWHQHRTDGKFLSISVIPEANDDDQLWAIVERTINGTVRRSVEYFPNTPDIPVEEEFYSGGAFEQEDLSLFLTAQWNTQKTLLHMDNALIYDGRLAATVNLTITGTLTTGSAVTVTASAGYFSAAMATNRRRIQSPYGGQIEITGYTSPTVVTGVVLYDVEAANLAAGEWYYMVPSLTGLFHLEGSDVSVLADGGVIEGLTVSGGTITLDEHSGYVIVGLAYRGIAKLQSIEGGGGNGRAQTKPRAITYLGVKFRNSIGTAFGTSLYNTEIPAYRQTDEVAGRPPRLFSGSLAIQIPDGFDEGEKNIYIVHEKPTPSNIQYIQARLETND